MNEIDIAFETKDQTFWIEKTKMIGRTVFKVWQNGITHSKLRGTFDFPDEKKSFDLAKNHAIKLSEQKPQCGD